MRKPRLFDTFIDWAILVALIGACVWVLNLVSSRHQQTILQDPPDPRTEIQQLRSRIEALERRLP